MKREFKGFAVLAVLFAFFAFCGALLMSVENCPHFYHLMGAIQILISLIILGSMAIIFALKYGED